MTESDSRLADSATELLGATQVVDEGDLTGLLWRHRITSGCGECFEGGLMEHGFPNYLLLLGVLYDSIHCCHLF